MTQPIEQLAALSIGTVESVSPSEIRVVLDPDAPQTTALNAGVPSGFPRINGYVLIPNETGAVVGMIVWLGVERSQFPRRQGLKDYGLIDLPFPLRKLSLTPLGTLVARRDNQDSDVGLYELERGIRAFPSVGDTAQLPTNAQLRAIVEASSESDKRVRIGASPNAAQSSVTVDPDKLFGRHLAVLGNTGSGKSCSVAGLIRWSLEEARAARNDNGTPNARFIILDPNGEYTAAFADHPKTRTFKVTQAKKGAEQLRIPAWIWNSEEWAAFSRAAPGTQRPILLQALRNMRAGVQLSEAADRQCSRVLRSYRASLESRIAQGTSGYQGWPEMQNCGGQIRNLATDSNTHAQVLQQPISSAVLHVAEEAEAVLSTRHYVNASGADRYNDFSETDLRRVLEALDSAIEALPLATADQIVSEDAPVPFELDAFPDHIDQLAADAPGGQAAQFLASLTMRIRMMLADTRLGPIVHPAGNPIAFGDWLASYVGDDNAEGGELAIIDLSLVPADVLHICISVIARVVFEACQRYHRINHCELPTTLVLEEAHTFVKRGSEEDDGHPTTSQVCRRAFEKIAREGRKFGLGLVLSSQRPSELSPTVLAQCNTFLLHRIVNDRDQELVGRLVPDNLGGILKELPSLPTRHAILMGWAALVPTLLEVRELSEAQRPQSPDPKFWEVWTGKLERRIDWAKVVEEWTGIASAENGETGNQGVTE